MPKVNKNKIKSKPEKLVHPNSRKAIVLARKTIRAHRIDRNKGERDLNQSLTCQKYLWFRENIGDEAEKLLPDEVIDIIDRYLHRFDDELGQIEIINGIKGRKKTQHLSRKKTIKFTIERESQQFNESGFYLPNLLSKEVVSKLRSWNKSPNTVANIKEMKVTRLKLQNLAKNAKYLPSVDMDVTDDCSDLDSSVEEHFVRKKIVIENIPQEEGFRI